MFPNCHSHPVENIFIAVTKSDQVKITLIEWEKNEYIVKEKELLNLDPTKLITTNLLF